MVASSKFDFDVVVAGGGPSGMSVAIEMALRGVRTLIVDPRAVDDYAVAKVNLINARSMEHYRRWGIADKHRANDPVSPKIKRDLVFATRANGHVIFRIEGAYEWPSRIPVSAEIPEWAPMQAVEKTLRERLLELEHATFLSHSSVTDFVLHDDSVDVTYEERGQAKQVRARYFIIANGPHSEFRRKLNLRLEGETLFYNTSWHFRSPDLGDKFKKIQLSSCTYFINEDGAGDGFVAQGGDDRWLYMASPIPEGVNAENWDEVKAMMVRCLGTDFEATEAQGWVWGSHARLTRSFHYGRAFLVGDAAHLTPPFGGFGANMGISGAVDLGWKIAAMVQGWGGPRLLETYTLERAPVNKFIIEGSAHNNRLWGKALYRPHLEDDSPLGEQTRADLKEFIVKEKMQQFRSLGAQLGYRYTGSPIIIGDGRAAPPPMTYGEYVPSSVPGCRTPHVWLGDNDSLYDHFGDGFCLLKLSANIDTRAMETAAAEVGLPLKVLQLDNPAVSEAYERRLTLIRPDQHVAWRGDELPDNCAWVIDTVRGAAGYR